MRKSLWVAALCWCAIPTTAWAQNEALTLLDRAIRAHGGEKNLYTLRAGHLQCRGTVFLPAPLPFTNQIFYYLPDHLKQIEVIESQGRTITVATGLCEDRVWRTLNGQDQEVDKKILTEIREAAHLLVVNRLVPLKSQTFQLTFLGQAAVNDRPALGIKVSAEGHRDVQLYFDARTKLLIKLVHRIADLKTGKDVVEERLFSDYRSVNGIQQPRKLAIWRDGKKLLEAEVTEARIFEKLDRKVFDKMN